MSLLEVLIAMFVITIGLLGVAALIPTGHFAVVKSTEADRAAACGRAALSEAKIRGMLDWNAWRWPNGTPGVGVVQYGDAFAIDPLGIANNSGVAAMWAFPYDVDVAVPTWGNFYLGRITFADVSGLMTPPILPPSIAERLFTFGDDVIFDVERTEPDRRARASVLWSDGSVSPYPVLPTETAPSGTVLRQELGGHYTWMLTVAPAATEIGASAFRKYTVSAVVSLRRNTTYPDPPINWSNPPDAENMPSERLATVALLGGGYGGGDVTLGVPPAAGGALSAAQREAYLKVRPGNWIMLMGLKYDARLDVGGILPRPGLPGQRRVARWYRVISVDDELTAAGTRNITLDGPDWDPAITTAAVLMDDVIGVYSKTIEVGE